VRADHSHYNPTEHLGLMEQIRRVLKRGKIKSQAVTCPDLHEPEEYRQVSIYAASRQR